MPAEVYEDSLELTVGILEAVLPDSGQYLKSAYPFPSLKSTGRSERRTFRTIVLENAFLRATIVPDLGGRILRVFDKRTSAEILPIEPVTTVDGGTRGVEAPQGIQVRYTNADRPNALSTVNYQLVPADDEEDNAAVWIGEVGIGLSFNALISVPPDSSELNIELRLFNRLIGNTPYNGGISICLPDAKSYLSSIHPVADERGFVLYSKSRDCGLSVWTEAAKTLAVAEENKRLTLHRFGSKSKFALGPRQLDTLKFRIVPHSGLGHLPAVCSQLAMEVGSKGIALQATKRLENFKLLVLTKDGQSFESPIDAYAEHRKEISFASLSSRVSEVAVMDADRNVLLRHIVGSRFAPIRMRHRDAMDASANEETKLRRQMEKVLVTNPEFAKTLPSVRFEAHLLSAMRGASAGSDALLEQALIYNGEDHLTWWMKAIYKRLASGAQEESAELLNAHYLAPLEPALRGEGFLTQPSAQGRGANPILKPLAESPEQFIEVACLLIDLDLHSEASRFIDEALRHEDIPMLHYLQAFLLMQGTRMAVEAADQVRAASSKPFAPPFPWRKAEINALESLSSSFPNDDRLRQYLVATSLYSGPHPLA